MLVFVGLVNSVWQRFDTYLKPDKIRLCLHVDPLTPLSYSAIAANV